MESQQAFYTLLRKMILEGRSLSQEDTTEIHNQLIEMVMKEQVTSSVVVQSISSVFKDAPAEYRVMIHFMNAIYRTSQMSDKYSYPEFFWIIVQNNILSNLDELSDIIGGIVDFCNPQILRDYLSYLLMTLESSYHKTIIFAFYYVGHTIETLKLVTEILPTDKDHAELYNFVYSNAISLLFGERSKTLSDENNIWLQEFFKKGLELGHEQIEVSCQKALEKLANIHR